MKVYALWWGGSDYRPPYHTDDVEEFASIRAAEEEFWSRSDLDGYPAGALMDLFAYDPREAHDPLPDWRLTIGPRGGVRRERC